MARISVNVDNIGSVYRRYPPLIRWDRSLSIDNGTGSFGNRLTVSSVNYGGVELFDNGYVDSNYELTDPLPTGATAYQRLIFSSGVSSTRLTSLSSVNMKVTWTGGAAISSISFGGDANNNIVVNLGSRFATFTFKASGIAPQGGNYTVNSWIVFNFTGTAGPPTNIKIFEAANETLIGNGVLFDATWISSVQSWDVLRLMDFMNTNNSGAVNYSDIATDSFVSWAQFEKTNGRLIGPPASTVAAAAIQSGRPVWICIPHQFTDAAITSYAQALNTALPAGSPMLYVEFSNETWNSTFTQTAYCQAQGALISAWSGDSSFTQGNKWSGLRSAQISSIFRNVFGTNSGTRWTGVLAMQLGSTTTLDYRIIGVDYFLNPSNGLLRSGDISTTLFNHVAGAPYFGPVPTTTASGSGAILEPYVNAGDQELFNQYLYDQIKGSTVSNSTWGNIAMYRTLWQAVIATAAGRGWTTAMYEGGNGAVVGLPLRDNLSGETNGTAFNLMFARFADSEQCAKLHDELYRLWIADRGVLPNKYNIFGEHSKFGPWGLQQDLSDANAVYQKISALNTAAGGRLR